MDFRPEIVAAARWCVANKPAFRYLESRPFPLFVPSTAHVMEDDCSSTSILCCWMAHAPEPFAGAYAGIGNTETFLELEHITDPQGGDFVVYGEGLPLGDQHMAVVLEAGSDPLTMSHGMPSEPAFVNAIQGCPSHAQGRITYIRAYPVSPPAPIPTEEDMLLIVTNPNNNGQAVLNLADGTYFGFPDPDMLTFYEANGVKVAKRQPTKAEWAHFSQKGTI